MLLIHSSILADILLIILVYFLSQLLYYSALLGSSLYCLFVEDLSRFFYSTLKFVKHIYDYFFLFFFKQTISILLFFSVDLKNFLI